MHRPLSLTNAKGGPLFLESTRAAPLPFGSPFSFFFVFLTLTLLLSQVHRGSLSLAKASGAPRAWRRPCHLPLTCLVRLFFLFSFRSPLTTPFPSQVHWDPHSFTNAEGSPYILNLHAPRFSAHERVARHLSQLVRVFSFFFFHSLTDPSLTCTFSLPLSCRLPHASPWCVVFSYVSCRPRYPCGLLAELLVVVMCSNTS